MAPHISVMTQEVLQIFREHSPQDAGEIFVDATLGGGGHTEALLDSFPGCRVVGLDRDEDARKMAGERLAAYGERLSIVATHFARIWPDLREYECRVRGVLFDLGVSNMQITTPERGFSFQDDGPLDMRMDVSSDCPTALDIIRESTPDHLSHLFRTYGDERFSYRIAKGICAARERGELPETTGALVALIREILPAPVQRKSGGNPARRVFQALRIVVNSELEELIDGLTGAYEVSGAGGVIEVMSYHSLEDRIVKNTFRRWQLDGYGSIITKRPLTPSEEEIESNRSARSAKLRAFKVRDDKRPLKEVQ